MSKKSKKKKPVDRQSVIDAMQHHADELLAEHGLSQLIILAQCPGDDTSMLTAGNGGSITHIGLVRTFDKSRSPESISCE